MIMITHICRRRGTLGITHALDEHAFDVGVTGPYEGIYRKTEACSNTEIHLNYGRDGCEWVESFITNDYATDSVRSHWIEDRRAERMQAMLELRIESVRQDFCTDGN